MVVIAVASFTDAVSKIKSALTASPRPSAAFSVEQNDDGSATLALKISDLPPDRNADWIVLSLRQTHPEGFIVGNPSTQVRAVIYTALITPDLLAQDNAELRIEANLLRPPEEPYAYAKIVLWLDRPGYTTQLEVKPTFEDANHKALEVDVQPESVQLELKSYSSTRASAGSP
jgi:hypothetical protein